MASDRMAPSPSPADSLLPRPSAGGTGNGPASPLSRSDQAARGPGSAHADSEPATTGAVQVAEVVRIAWGGQARVLAGQQGLRRRVGWVTSLRGLPPIFESSGGDEVVLAPASTLAALRELGAGYKLTRVLTSLAEAGSAAVVILSRDAWSCSSEVIALANQLALPLVAVQTTTSAGAFERAIIRLVVARQAELQQRATQLYRQLAAVSLEGEGLERIIQAAAQATGRVVCFEDASYHLRTYAPAEAALPTPYSALADRRRLEAALQTEPLTSAAPPGIRLPPNRLGLARCAAPVLTRDRLRGFVSLCAPPDELTELDELAAGRVAAVLALELTKQDAVRVAERRERDVLFDQLLQEAASLSPELLRQLGRVGFDSAAHIGAIAARPEPDSTAECLRAEATADRFDRLIDVMSRLLRGRSQPALVREGNEEVVALVALHSPPGTGQEAAAAALQATLAAVHEAAMTSGAGPVSCGASEVHGGLAEAPAAVREAAQAAHLSSTVYGPGRRACLSDLGLYRLLYHLRDSPQLQAFCEQTLGRLAAYDHQTGADLIPTLEAYFACRGNLNQTARRLNLHRNSLPHRIARIQEVGHVNLQDPEALLALQVALKARALLAH